jgi:predicted dehydrogenase
MKDGQNYSPEFQMEKAVEPGQFVFAAAYFDHGHIYGQIGNLAQTGATLGYIYDTDPSGQRIKQVTERFPDAKVVSDFNEILKAPEVQLVTSAAIPSERCAVGLQVLEADKDYFTDKSPFTTLDQLEQARRKVEATGRRYMVSFSERLQTEAGWHAGELVKSGAIGSPLQILILAPHRLSKATRPDWFFDKEKYGGILTDIGSHQFEQFLTYAGASDASINFARVENFANADKPGLEDFGESIAYHEQRRLLLLPGRLVHP